MPAATSSDISVTLYIGGQQIPATVTRLLKTYFEVTAADAVRQLKYNGQPRGARRITKAHERRYGLNSSPGITYTDLTVVRTAAGLPPNP